MADYKITLLKGDGIGPEIVNQAVKVLDCAAPRQFPDKSGVRPACIIIQAANGMTVSVKGATECTSVTKCCF